MKEPWHYLDFGPDCDNCGHRKESSHVFIGRSVDKGWVTHVHKDHAPLIVAAPEMYNTLRAVQKCGKTECSECKEAINKVLAKASSPYDPAAVQTKSK